MLVQDTGLGSMVELGIEKNSRKFVKGTRFGSMVQLSARKVVEAEGISLMSKQAGHGVSGPKPEGVFVMMDAKTTLSRRPKRDHETHSHTNTCLNSAGACRFHVDLPRTFYVTSVL